MAYYDVLGLESQCTQDEIKKAYRRLAIKVSTVRSSREDVEDVQPLGIRAGMKQNQRLGFWMETIAMEAELMIVTSR